MEKDEDTLQALERIRKSEIYLDNVRGCLFGGAVGEALGYPVESMSDADIRRRFGAEGITEYVLDSKSHQALISAGTQMTLFTITGSLLGNTRAALRGIGGWPPDYLPTHYDDWLQTQI